MGVPIVSAAASFASSFEEAQRKRLHSGYIISVIQTLRVAAGEDWGAVRTNDAQPHHEAGGLSKL